MPTVRGAGCGMQTLPAQRVGPSVDNMVSFRALQPYIYKFIRSSPCPELLRQVREALQETDIYGILTRGSLAQYLYVN